jgi:hypothetical protein
MTSDIPCITQDMREALAAGPDYLAVCTGTAELISTSIYCEGTGCGGHPVCRPCYELGKERGLIR